jgi:hypothetical protein
MNRALKLATLVYLVVRTFHSGLALAREIREAAEHEAGRVEGTDDIDLSGIPDAVLDSWRKRPPTITPEDLERMRESWSKFGERARQLLESFTRQSQAARGTAGEKQRAEAAERADRKENS